MVESIVIVFCHSSVVYYTWRMLKGNCLPGTYSTGQRQYWLNRFTSTVADMITIFSRPSLLTATQTEGFVSSLTSSGLNS